ncbi:MAG: ArsA family ATPase [Kaiparowitsia implicata GSE-PSE-MK54-09C]|jgi:arsenite-transporting ATPase|nr:ArsA family ATPase [Kaiparowitsia implicata GSE-PSE-MK54-09C]
MQWFDERQLILVSGKGGVGKTTFSCGLARQWTRQFPAARVLLLSTDPAHSLGDVLQQSVTDEPTPMADLPNVQVRSLDAQALLVQFKARYGAVLEQLVERGSFVEGDDLSPVWDLSWPGLDELMALLEIQRILRDGDADRVVVDMAPSGHSINLFQLMDFLEEFLAALALFQENHRVIQRSFTGQNHDDAADDFLQEMTARLLDGRQLLQDAQRTAVWAVAIAQPMSLLETERLLRSLETLQIPCGGLVVNHLLPVPSDACAASEPLSPLQAAQVQEQQLLLDKFQFVAGDRPLLCLPHQSGEPVGTAALDALMTHLHPVTLQTYTASTQGSLGLPLPQRLSPSLDDFITAGRRLVIVGGKGGVGKTTVAGAIAWGMAQRHPNAAVRVISIDPAHSLADAFGQPLGHEFRAIAPLANLTGQEIDAHQVLDRFREDYLWELAAMMSGDTGPDDTLQLAYRPEAWRRIVSQALPGIDEMLSLIHIMELLESDQQQLIVLDTAPTGHLLRFLEMPSALGNWLGWIFKLWLKYQDAVGRVELMGRLRTLRQRVMQARKRLIDPSHTEFIGVMQAQSAIWAESARLSQSLTDLGMSQRYLVQNFYESGQCNPLMDMNLPTSTPSSNTQISSSPAVVRLPKLPRGALPHPYAPTPLGQVQLAADLLFAP